MNTVDSNTPDSAKLDSKVLQDTLQSLKSSAARLSIFYRDNGEQQWQEYFEGLEQTFDDMQADLRLLSYDEWLEQAQAVAQGLNDAKERVEKASNELARLRDNVAQAGQLLGTLIEGIKLILTFC